MRPVSICPVSVAGLLVSIAILVYSAVALSRSDRVAQQTDTTEEERKRQTTLYIVLIAFSAAGVLISLARLGYLNWAAAKLRLVQGNMHPQGGWELVRGKKHLKEALKHAKKHGWTITGADPGIPIKDLIDQENKMRYTNTRFPDLTATVDYDSEELRFNMGEPKIIRI